MFSLKSLILKLNFIMSTYSYFIIGMDNIIPSSIYLYYILKYLFNSNYCVLVGFGILLIYFSLHLIHQTIILLTLHEQLNNLLKISCELQHTCKACSATVTIKNVNCEEALKDWDRLLSGHQVAVKYCNLDQHLGEHLLDAVQ